MRSYYDPGLLDIIRRSVYDGLKVRNWVSVEDDIFVRIPHGKEVTNRIYKHQNEGNEEILVDLIYETWYDKDTRQSRNRKARIGTIPPLIPGAMIINKNYEKFFDLETGKLLKPLKGAEEAGEEIQPAARKPAELQEQTTPQPIPGQEAPEQATRPNDKPEEEDLDQIIRDSLREVRRKAEEREKAEREKKIRGEEDERKRELFADMPEEEDPRFRESRKRLQAIADRIRAELEQEEQGQQKDMNEEESRNPTAAAPDTDVSANPDSPADPDNPNNPDNPPDTDVKDQRIIRLAVLNQILRGFLESIRNQAKKKPDAIVNTYKAQTINKILTEIQGYYQGSGYEDLLTLVEEPGEEEHDGRVILTGMTYSDVEVLLEKYIAIVRFIRNKST